MNGKQRASQPGGVSRSRFTLTLYPAAAPLLEYQSDRIDPKARTDRRYCGLVSGAPECSTSRPLLQSLQSNLRLQHLSRRTEAAYIYWAKRFVRFCGLRHPSELGAAEVRQFLSHLVVERNLSAATQQQALGALLFLYRNVLGRSPRGSGRPMSAGFG